MYPGISVQEETEKDKECYFQCTIYRPTVYRKGTPGLTSFVVRSRPLTLRVNSGQ